MRLWVKRLLLSSPALRCRSFHHVYAQAKDPEIFEDSLEKTLEVHRSTNRQNLIRKVFSRSDPEKPVRPTLPATDSAESGSSVSLGSLGTENQLPKASLELSDQEDASTAKKSSKKPSNVPASRPGFNLRRPFDAPVSWTVRNGKREQCPWLVEMERSQPFSGGISQLDRELGALEKHLTPTTQEDAVTEQILTNVIKHLTNIEPSNGFHVIGSRCTGFAMSHSDVNIMVTFPDGQWTDDIRKPSANRPERLLRYRKFLDQALCSLEQLPSYRSRGVDRLRALAVDHRPTSIRLRFYCGETIPACLEYIQDFHAEYPALRPLYMATRLILESRRVFRRVIDPLALQMLIAAFLKMNHGRFQRDTGCAEPLLAFLYTFGTEVDFTSTGVAIDPPGFFTADSIKEESAQYAGINDLPAHLRGQRALLKGKKRAAVTGNKTITSRICLQDPANYMKDLGSSCSRTREMQSAFADAHDRLRSALDSWEPSNPLTPGTGILGTALRANFEDFEARRARIVAHGVAIDKR
ncbi:hypothetical protein BDV12DRAFT_175381 [Aspergillus spectabilis]